MLEAWLLLRHALIISAFVAVMMLLIEYSNVVTRGLVLRTLGRSRWRQYLVGAALGAIPGCLGAFVAVNLYSHRALSLGAVVATMVATMGDETFVMLALVPETALWMIPALAVLGVLAAWLTDLLLPRHLTHPPGCCEGAFELHGEHDEQAWLPFSRLPELWRKPQPHRVILTVLLGALTLGIMLGGLGPKDWNWVRVTLLVVMLFGLFVVSTVSEHFLDEHLWKHVFVGHLPRIFLWTLGSLVLLHWLDSALDLSSLLADNTWTVLGIALLVGFIPESGPHLFFVTMFASGHLPLAVLMASSIAQDGHGMLPMLAHSRRTFLLVKGLNVAFGGLVGALLLWLS
ncbi:MAG: putative manganese transporter [Myxococcota bacterium]|nr:putative manganese transporter [Myxococcota bacterium]